MTDAIANIPGSEEIQRKADKIFAGNVGSIESMRSSFQKAHQEATDSHNDLVTAIEAAKPNWSGTGADAFHSYMQKFTDASAAAKELLNRGIQGLNQAVQQLQKAQADVTNAMNDMAKDFHNQMAQAQSAYEAAHKTDPDAQPPDPDAIGRTVIAAHKGAIDQAVQEYDQAMDMVARDLNQALTASAAQRFTAISPPGHAGTSAQSAPVGHSGHHSGGGGVNAGALSAAVPPDVQVSGDVDQWIQQAKELLAQQGIYLSDDDIKALKVIIQHESGGNPNAANGWDSNAAAGHPSIGLMQTIQPTFDANKVPGHGNIKDPVDNICAGVQYAIHRYGSLENVPGVKAVAHGRAYVGY